MKKITAMLLALVMMLTLAPLTLSVDSMPDLDPDIKTDNESNVNMTKPTETDDYTKHVTSGGDITVSELADAINAPGYNGTYTNDETYPWVEGDFNGIPAGMSSTAGIDRSTTSLFTTVQLQAGELFVFDWLVSSEGDIAYSESGASSSGYYDFLSLYVNYMFKFRAKGQMEEFSTYSFRAPETGTYMFEWRYIKDSGDAAGLDAAFIKNAHISEGGSAESVTLNTTAASVYEGGTAQLTAEVMPETANGAVTWTSSDETIATVDENGLVSGVSVGTTTVTATCVSNTAITATCEITVISIDEANRALREALNVEGGTIPFINDMVNPWVVDDGSYAPRTAVKSAIEGMDDTATTITASVEVNAGATINFDYFVSSENVRYDLFTFYVNSVPTFEAGGTDMTGFDSFTYEFTESGVYELAWEYSKDGSDADGLDATWLDNVVLDNGTALEGIALNPASMDMLVGNMRRITVSPVPATAVLSAITWASDNEAVAAVDASGLVTAVAEGTATITATSAEGFTATTTVTVQPPAQDEYVYVRTDEILPRQVYVIGAVDENGDFYVMTDSLVWPEYGIQIVGTPATLGTHEGQEAILGDIAATEEWLINAVSLEHDGVTIRNLNSLLYINTKVHNNSFWTGLVADDNMYWTWDAENEYFTTSNRIYTDPWSHLAFGNNTEENDFNAFDLFADEQSHFKLRLYVKQNLDGTYPAVPQIPADIDFGFTYDRAYEDLRIDVSMTTDVAVNSGRFTCNYDPTLVEFAGYTVADALTGFTCECNPQEGAVEFIFEGESALFGAYELVSFEFTALAEGEATFELVVNELIDVNGVSRAEEAIAAPLEVEVGFGPSALDEALNVEGGTLHFESCATYPWTTRQVEDRLLAVSTNHLDATRSYFTLTRYMEVGECISFDYMQHGQIGRDSFNFYHDETHHIVNTALEYPDAHFSPIPWTTVRYVVEEADMYTFVWEYVKNESISFWDDETYIDNVAIEQLDMPESAIITPDQIAIWPGATIELSLVVTPADATTYQFAWSSSNESIATIDENGVVTGVAEGTAIITAYAESLGITATATVTVSNNDQIFYGSIVWGGIDDPGGLYEFDMKTQSITEIARFPGTVYSMEYVDGILYAYSMQESGLWKYYVIDAADYSWTERNVQRGMFDLSYDYTTDKLYGLYSSGSNMAIFEINMTTGAATEVITLDQTEGAALTFAITTEGEFYTITRTTGNLYHINKTTGEQTLVGPTGIVPDFGQSMTYDHNNDQMLWAYHYNFGAAFGGIAAVSLESGRATRLWDQGLEITGIYTIPHEVTPPTTEPPITTPPTTEPPAEYEMGDVNMDGTLNTGDAAALLRRVVGLITLTEQQLALGDVNNDSLVNTGDAAAILHLVINRNQIM